MCREPIAYSPQPRSTGCATTRTARCSTASRTARRSSADDAEVEGCKGVEKNASLTPRRDARLGPFRSAHYAVITGFVTAISDTHHGPAAICQKIPRGSSCHERSAIGFSIGQCWPLTCGQSLTRQVTALARRGSQAGGPDAWWERANRVMRQTLQYQKVERDWLSEQREGS
jgi:hypothetical protein